MNNYKYFLKSDPKKEEFDTEVALSTAHSEVCQPNTHEWKSTFVFGDYNCKKCNVRKELNTGGL